MSRLRLLLVLLVALTLPALAQTGNARVDNFLAQISSVQTIDQGVAVIEADPEVALLAFQAVIQGLAQGAFTGDEEVTGALGLLNLIARTFEVRLGQPELSEGLAEHDLLTDPSNWAGTVLAGGTSVDPGGVPGWNANGGNGVPATGGPPATGNTQVEAQVLEAQRDILLHRLAEQVGNFIVSSQIAAGLVEKLQNIGKFAMEAGETQLAIQLTQAQIITMAYTVLSLERSGLSSFVLESGPQLMEMLTSSSEFLDAETAADLALFANLTLARAAFRTGQPQQTEQYLSRVAQLTGGAQRPTVLLSRFIAESFRQQLAFERDPSIDAEQFIARHDQVWALLRQLPPEGEVEGLWPLGVDAMRFWFSVLAELYNRYPEDHPKALRIEKLATDDIEFLAAHFQRAAEVPNAGSEEALDTLLNRGALSLGLGLGEILLDIVRVDRRAGQYDDLPENLQTALSFIEECQRELQPLEQAVEGHMPAGTSLLEGSILQRLRARYHEEAGRLAQQQNQAGGQSHLQQAMDLYSRGGDLAAFMDVAPTYWWLTWQAGDRTGAAQGVDDVIEMSRQAQYRPGLIEALIVKARMQAEQGDRQGALKSLNEATGMIEEYVATVGGSAAAAQRIRGRSQEAYTLMGQLQIEIGNAQSAFDTMARAGQVQSVANLGSKLQSSDPQTQQKLVALRADQQRTQALEDQVTKLRTAPEGQRDTEKLKRAEALLADSKASFLQKVRELRTTNPEYANLLSVNPIEFGRLQSTIPADTAVVQFFPTATKLHFFVVTSDQFRIRTVDATADEITELIRKYRVAIRNYSRSPVAFNWSTPEGQSLAAILTEMHSILVDPVEADIAAKPVVAFIPTSSLHYMPLQSMARKAADGSLEFLIQRKQVVVLTNPTDLMQLTRPAAGGGATLAAFGNPDGTLPSAAQEVRELAALFPGSKVFLEGEATEDKLMNSSAGATYLHLATHGHLSNHDPNSSYLVLASNAELTPPEIFALPLANTRMVTLSACETALGGTNPGQDVTSLAEAFWAAGPPTVMASLWSVSDESTRQLMVDVYGRLKNGESKAQALQQAQVAMLTSVDYAHPFHWAPFVLLGDWR